MARYISSKCRLCRREGIKLFLKGNRCYSAACPLERKGAVPPGERHKVRRRPSGYSLRLREKQKTKRYFCILEKQFKNYYKKAQSKKGDTGMILLQLLESRLDNVVRLLGFARSLNFARQLVTHGHIRVNGEKVDIPSYNMKKGQTVSLSEKALNFLNVQKALEEAEPDQVPEWLERKGAVGKVKRLPESNDFGKEIDPGLIIEYYSR